MHSPNQQSPDESLKQPENETQEEQVSQPLFEFPPSGPQLNEPPLVDGQGEVKAAPGTEVLPETRPEPVPVHEAGQQGFVYPPPPSFYQNMVVPPQQSALPLPNTHMAGGLAYGPQIVDRQAHPVWETGNMPLQEPGPGPQGATQTYPPPFVPQPPAKKSNTWVWVIVTIISIAVLASCGLCSWGAYTLFNTTYQQVAGATDVVNDYYSNLQARNYTAAYHDLAPQGLISGLTQEQFIQQATQRDTQFGPVTSFMPGQPSFSSDANTGPDLSRFTMTIDVKRPHLHYTVLLTVSKIGGNWKITDFDRI